MKRDAIIVMGMVLSVAGAVFMIARGRLIFTRLGFFVSVVAVCIGLAYFGWLPLIGGSLSTDTIFGSVILFIGLLGFCIFGAIEEMWHRLAAPLNDRRGFPIVPSRRSEEPE